MWLQRSSSACWEQTGKRMHLVSSLKNPHELSLNSPGTVSLTDIHFCAELFKWKCVGAHVLLADVNTRSPSIEL